MAKATCKQNYPMFKFNEKLILFFSEKSGTLNTRYYIRLFLQHLKKSTNQTGRQISVSTIYYLGTNFNVKIKYYNIEINY